MRMMSITAVDESCSYCGSYHMGVCPRIEEIEYYPNGSVKRVKLRPQFGGVYHSEPEVNVTWDDITEVDIDG